MVDQEPRRIAFETARLRLARITHTSREARDTACRLVTQVIADALRVDRVGAWFFEQEDRLLVCKMQFLRDTRQYEQGQVLHMDQYPRYHAALREHRALAANDARNNPITRELAESYLAPAGIVSMLDAPIIRGENVVGVICLEETDSPRSWTQTEIDFCGSTADIAALVLEQADRAALEAALKVQAEQRLEQHKLEALGRMARSVAHDINNLLTVVLAVADDARAEATSRSGCVTCTRAADSLSGTAELGQRLVQQLLGLGQRNRGPGSGIDVDVVLITILPTLRILVGPRISLDLRRTASSSSVILPQAEMEQIVLNLVVNARDAITDHGRIDIVLRDPGADDDLPDEAVPPLLLEVTDNGAGMNDHTRAHLFEPYFSTKPNGHGLGLAIVYGIVTRAGGTINVASAVGAGTRFQIVLPRA